MLEREEIENGWLVTVQSPATSFLMIGIRSDRPAPETLAESTLDDLRSSYPELEFERGSTPIAGRLAHGYDVRFFLFDLTNTCWVRTFQTHRGTVLVLWQVSDLEMESHEPLLRAIYASLKVH